MYETLIEDLRSASNMLENGSDPSGKEIAEDIQRAIDAILYLSMKSFPVNVGDDVWSAVPFTDGRMRKGEVVQLNIGHRGFQGFWVSFYGEPISAEFLAEDLNVSCFLHNESLESSKT